MLVVSSMEVERRIGTQTGNNALAQAQNLALQAESARLKALVDELDLAQLSANNRQELSRAPFRAGGKNRASSWMPIWQALRNLQNSQRQREAEKALESTELLAENSENLPPDITAQFKVNRELSQALNQQAQRHGSGGIPAAAGDESNAAGGARR
ncbi:potassium efflux system KefA protein [Klebsiella pneumoniae]|uniref:Potassium efflux system KefA protein n=1 Tax=Klebsiella pneumoniae TaxID=573 RepID=A0A3S4HVW0_KLEPN|nr:potassium efflux system KefA protein [Klebsiella pneumoniae]